jgi:Uma2 family endonuclease
MAIEPREQPPAGRIVLTYEDYCALPDDGKRYEIIEGDLYVTPSPGRAHQEFVGNLFIVLKTFARTRELGDVFIAPFDVILEETSVVVPDLLFVGRDRSGIVTDRGVRGAPDLIVEILSPGTARRDRVEKAKLYARHGVRHYWLADPETRALEVYELSEGQYRRTASLADDDSFAPSLFPGLTIQLGSLWG